MAAVRVIMMLLARAFFGWSTGNVIAPVWPGRPVAAIVAIPIRR